MVGFNNGLILNYGKGIGAAVSGDTGNTITFPLSYKSYYSIVSSGGFLNNDAAVRWVKFPVRTLTYIQAVTGWVNFNGWSYEAFDFHWLTIGQ